MITEVYTGNGNSFKIPIIVNEDSKVLIDSLYSTKKVRRKSMRVIISVIQQYLRNGTIQNIHHVNSHQQVAYIFTKYGVKSNNIKEAVSNGDLSFLTLRVPEEGVNLPIPLHEEEDSFVKP